MKMKLMALSLVALGFMNLQELKADDCAKGDWYFESSHECVYCPTTLTWENSVLGCTPSANQNICTHGDNPNYTHTYFCDYCSKGYKFNSNTKSCEKKTGPSINK